jgi:hydroxyacylglutathione hydrolase
VYDDRDWALIDVGYEESVDEIVEMIRELDFPLSQCRALVATHADVDHIQGLAKAKALLKAPVLAHPLAVASLETGDRIKTFAEIDAQNVHLDMPQVKVDREIVDGDTVEVGGARYSVIETPGHTLGHIAFIERANGLAFVGDTLFAMGCGRVIEGDYAMMWGSLRKIMALPPDTMVFCGHNYDAANAQFAVTIDPGNAALKARAQRAIAGETSVPMRLSDELATNPFLRADTPEIRAAVGLPDAAAWKVFGEIRDRKNRS